MSKKWLPKQTLPAKVIRGYIDNHELDDLIILKILVGTVRKFVQVKCSLYWVIKQCSLSCCSTNPHEKASNENINTLTL